MTIKRVSTTYIVIIMVLKILYTEIKRFVWLTPFWIEPQIINPMKITRCMVLSVLCLGE